MHIGLFDLEFVQVILRSGRAFFLNGCNLKTAHHRVKGMKIWASEMYVVCIFEHIKVIWDHSVHFTEKGSVTRKRLIIDQNGRKSGHGLYVACILEFFTLNMSMSFRVSRCTFSKMGHNSKTAQHRVKRMNH